MKRARARVLAAILLMSLGCRGARRVEAEGGAAVAASGSAGVRAEPSGAASGSATAAPAAARMDADAGAPSDTFYVAARRNDWIDRARFDGRVAVVGGVGVAVWGDDERFHQDGAWFRGFAPIWFARYEYSGSGGRWPDSAWMSVDTRGAGGRLGSVGAIYAFRGGEWTATGRVAKSGPPHDPRFCVEGDEALPTGERFLVGTPCVRYQPGYPPPRARRALYVQRFAAGRSSVETLSLPDAYEAGTPTPPSGLGYQPPRQYVAPRGPNDVYVIGGLDRYVNDPARDPERLYAAHFDGKAWTEIAPPDGTDVGGAAVAPDGTLYALAPRQLVRRGEDGSWTEAPVVAAGETYEPRILWSTKTDLWMIATVGDRTAVLRKAPVKEALDMVGNTATNGAITDATGRTPATSRRCGRYAIVLGPVAPHTTDLPDVRAALAALLPGVRADIAAHQVSGASPEIEVTVFRGTTEALLRLDFEDKENPYALARDIGAQVSWTKPTVYCAYEPRVVRRIDIYGFARDADW